VIAGLVGLSVAAIVIPILAGAVRNRNAADPITGSIPGAVDDPTSLSFYEQRVREHPNDVAARLDLAARYQQSGNAQGAVEQYLEVLNLDPENPEARANLGFVLYSAGRAEEGLASVRQALAIDPTYPDALYFEGIILLRGLNRPAEAADSFQAYLDAAPFGARRTRCRGCSRRLERAPRRRARPRRPARRRGQSSGSEIVDPERQVVHSPASRIEAMPAPSIDHSAPSPTTAVFSSTARSRAPSGAARSSAPACGARAD
jgi:tetratricopeptide (TPR) repeat protein